MGLIQEPAKEPRSGRRKRGYATWLVSAIYFATCSPVLATGTTSASTPDVRHATDKSPTEPVVPYLDRLARTSGYTVNVVGQWPEDSVIRRRPQDPDLYREITNTLNEIHGLRYVMEWDQDARVITVRLLQSFVESVPTEESEQIVVPKAEPAFAPRDYFAGMTDEVLESMKAEHAERMRNLPDDAEIFPPFEGARGITLREFEKLKEAYLATRENRDPYEESESVMPPSFYQGSVAK